MIHAKQVEIASSRICFLEQGRLRCLGTNLLDKTAIGSKQESFIDFQGHKVRTFSMSRTNTMCAILERGTLHCWG
ncbi:MAG: hypothetical protein AAGJ35_12170, partial [Myxococcota bacterium]